MKKELPRETEQFAIIDENVKKVLLYGLQKKIVFDFANDEYEHKIVYTALD